jgi:ribonuclease T1
MRAPLFSRSHCAARRLLLALVVLLLTVPPVAARGAVEALPAITQAELPKEGREVLAAIRSGGPFHYDRDGVAFGNRERILPPKHRGYYREYTVRTPGAKDRGARRIVCGGAATTPDACFYTSDHYQSFQRIRE